MRPRLRMRFGSKLSFKRSVSASTAGGRGWNTGTLARSASGARMSVAWPERSAARIAAAPPSSAPAIANQTRPPPQSRTERASSVFRIAARKPGAALGATETRQMVRARSPGAASGATSRSERHRPCESASSRISAVPKRCSSRAATVMRASTDGTGPSTRSTVAALSPTATPCGRCAAPLGSCAELSVSVMAAQHERARRFGPRQNFHGNFGQGRERAVGAGHELAKIITGDVLDDAPAGFERLAAAADPGEAEKMIARRALADAARPGEIACKDAADGWRGILGTEQPAPIARLEGEHLIGAIERRLDLGEWRRRAGGQHELFGLVDADAGKRAELEPVRGLRRTTEAALAAAAQQLQRLLALERLLDDAGEFLLVFRPKDRHGALTPPRHPRTSGGPGMPEAGFPRSRE